jgi:hypothetical protein
MMTSFNIEKALLAKEALFHTEGMDEDTLYKICRVIDKGILVVTEHLNKKYKPEGPLSPWELIGMTKEEYDKYL